MPGGAGRGPRLRRASAAVRRAGGGRGRGPAPAPISRAWAVGHSPLPGSAWPRATCSTATPGPARRPSAASRPSRVPPPDPPQGRHRDGDPARAGTPGRSPRRTTPHGPDSATPVTALTGTTTLIAPWLRPRLGKRIAVVLPAPESAPRSRSGAATAVTRRAAAVVSGRPPIRPGKVTAACGTAGRPRSRRGRGREPESVRAGHPSLTGARSADAMPGPPADRSGGPGRLRKSRGPLLDQALVLLALFDAQCPARPEPEGPDLLVDLGSRSLGRRFNSGGHAVKHTAPDVKTL